MSNILRQKSNIMFNKVTNKQVLNNLDAYSRSLEYQYLQVSKLPTLHFQKSLPRLPIPKLELTCERYLAAQRPLLINEAYRKTEANVNQFKHNAGQRLQQMLKAYDRNNRHTSYISEPWFDMYLRDRKSLPINYNPMLVMNNSAKDGYNDQLVRTTNLIISSLRFYKSLKSGLLEPEVYHLNPRKSDTELFRNICAKVPPAMSWYAAYLFKAYPLDMSQYPNLFNTTRIPETDKDRICMNKGDHITIQCNGHIYAFKVLDNEGNILPPEQLLARLKFILNDDVKPAEFPIGVLTTLERNKWATVRHSLAENGNESHLKVIDSALFNVVLDTHAATDDPRAVTRKFLHADGTNRWFDKSFSLIVAKDGVAGINFEHSWGDGVAVLRYVQDIFKDSEEKPRVHPDTVPYDEDINQVFRLDFNVNHNLKHAIKEAQGDYKKICDSLDINYLIFDGIGKQLCKKHGVSPDAIMQLGFQVAYHKIVSKFVATYESCSTAAFKHGRTETIRPCTMATKTFSLNVNSSNRPKNSELKQMILECSRVHNQLTREAAMGQGFDRHLFTLKRFADKANIRCNIFEAPDYSSMNYNIISTSTLNSPAVYAGGFGPVVKDGLGLGYVIKDDSLGVLLTTYSAYQNGPAFIDAVKVSFEEILNILESSN